ncbi:hypothetical protein D3C87_1099640 [compost metagenome]
MFDEKFAKRENSRVSKNVTKILLTFNKISIVTVFWVKLGSLFNSYFKDYHM